MVLQFRYQFVIFCDNVFHTFNGLIWRSNCIVSLRAINHDWHCWPGLTLIWKEGIIHFRSSVVCLIFLIHFFIIGLRIKRVVWFQKIKRRTFQPSWRLSSRFFGCILFKNVQFSSLVQTGWVKDSEEFTGLKFHVRLPRSKIVFY